MTPNRKVRRKLAFASKRLKRIRAKQQREQLLGHDDREFDKCLWEHALLGTGGPKSSSKYKNEIQV